MGVSDSSQSRDGEMENGAWMSEGFRTDERVRGVVSVAPVGLSYMD